MEQKKMRKGSFQEELIKLLREYPEEGLTSNDIAEKLGRSLGSTSGTLSVLCKHGVIFKNNDHPARYFGQELSNNISVISKYIKSPQGEQQQSQQSSDLEQIVTNLKQELAELDSRREKILSALEILEESLVSNKKHKIIK